MYRVGQTFSNEFRQSVVASNVNRSGTIVENDKHFSVGIHDTM